jgi:hypothetical protein
MLLSLSRGPKCLFISRCTVGGEQTSTKLFPTGLSGITDFYFMFGFAELLNQDVCSWDSPYDQSRYGNPYHSLGRSIHLCETVISNICVNYLIVKIYKSQDTNL